MTHTKRDCRSAADRNLGKKRPGSSAWAAAFRASAMLTCSCSRSHRSLGNVSLPNLGYGVREVSMTFAIHAWKDDQSIVTVRIGPAVAVDKARVLERSGWKVHVTDSTGRRFGPS